MDILAARKKAAELAKAVKAREGACVGPAVPDEPAAPAAPPEPEMRPTNEAPAAETNAAAPATAAPEPEKPGHPAPGVAESGPGEPDQPREEEELEMLAFLLGSEEYAVAVDRVREVLTPKEITPVPHTADYLVGVCSLRGTVMPVIDLNRRLGLAASTRDEKSRIIVVSMGPDEQVGMFVDRVQGVVRFLPSAVRPAPETVEQGAGAEFLKGIARKGDRLYILLDVEKAIGV